MSKLCSMAAAIAECVTDGATVALGLAMEQMIPFAAGHEIIGQRRKDLTLIGPISKIPLGFLPDDCSRMREPGDCGLGRQCDDGIGLQLSAGC